ncbi:MAG: LPS export ABC transporter periplasmic protein LptC [Flavobacteriaceae bacterium]|nr:LPS export ABC transporter periplasmic protein LptC [Flavobacteriaceae bacterium]
MKNITRNIYWSVAILFATLFFYSCDNSSSAIRQMSMASQEPSGIAENINLKHTDSAKLKAHLISKTMFDFSNKEFSYREFPDGLMLHFYDEKGNKSTLTASYGIIYDKTDLVDLRGEVKLVTHDGKILDAKQLYWDQKNNWIFTNEPYRYSFGGGFNEGDEFDANQEFTIFSSRNNHGQITTK